MQLSESIHKRILGGSELIWLAIALLTPLFVNLWAEQQFEASKVWLLRTLIWLLALAWMTGWLTGMPRRALPVTLRNLTLLLVLTMILATALSSYHYDAIFGSLERAQGVLTQLSYILLFLCVATMINGESSELLLRLVIFTALPICLLGLAQAAGWNPLPAISDARSPLITTLGRANFTGAYLAPLLPLTLVAILQTSTGWLRYGYALLFILELVVIGLTEARAAWIGAAIGLTLLIWLLVSPRRSVRTRWLTLGGVTALTGGILTAAMGQGIASGGSIAARWTIWQASLRLLWSHLFLGYGADTLELYFPAVYPPQLVYYQGRGVVVDRAHNWLLDWSLNYGIVATILFLALCFFVVRAGWRTLNQAENGSTAGSATICLTRPWIAACLAAVIAHLAGNFFLFDVAATATLFWLLLAIIAAAASAAALPAGTFRPLSAGILIIGLLLWVGAVWFGNLRPLLADVQAWQGNLALGQAQPENALSRYSAAAEMQPQRAAYHVAEALTAARLDEFARAKQSMARAINLHPDDPALYLHLATIHDMEAQQNGLQSGAAYDALDQAIALAPTIALSYQQYAEIAYLNSDLDLAQRQAEQAINLDATAGVAFGILGWTLLERGELTNAILAFENAVIWEPLSANFYLGLATAAYQSGDIARAQQAVAWSLQLNPSYEPALTLQSQLRDT